MENDRGRLDLSAQRCKQIERQVLAATQTKKPVTIIFDQLKTPMPDGTVWTLFVACPEKESKGFGVDLKKLQDIFPQPLETIVFAKPIDAPEKGAFVRVSGYLDDNFVSIDVYLTPAGSNANE